MTRTRYLRKLILVAFLVAIGARIYFSFFVDGFIVTFTAIILALSLYFSEDIHPIHLGMAVAIVSPGMRYIVDYVYIDGSGLFSKVYPDIFFYLTYGIVYYEMKRYFGPIYKGKFYLIAFFSDFLSNLVELLVRTKISGMEWGMVQGIILVAIGRTFIIMFFIYLTINYTTLLVKQQHEKRYQYLMMQSSRFKSEIYFLHKNMNQIESMVALSHKLKGRVKEDEELKGLALELSKGVHEVKKDYLRVIRGLEDIYHEAMDLKEISIKDLFTILEVNTNDYLRSKDSFVECHYKCKVDIMVKEHFYLMSILRNLVNNGIDACEVSGRIDILAQEIDGEVYIYVKDTGTGIADNDSDYIFNTGYSTKFDEATGNISRGLGLTLVKEMVENIFEGTIEFDSSYGVGTTFLVRLNLQRLKEGSDYAILYS